jgi:GPH family glycoside/pentoside/hexuronide:cation symporter
MTSSGASSVTMIEPIDGLSASRTRLTLFAFGDFAFNLFWQSVMLFLLYHYTDNLGLPIGIAATIFMIASVWDGIANFIAGVTVDRSADARGYRTLLAAGSLPLALAFVLAYLPPAGTGWVGLAGVLVCHLLFRTAYAAVNVPFLAMSARISGDSRDRAFVAGMRMLFGTAAAVLVALATVPIGEWLTGRREPAQAFLASAFLFAVLGTAVLLLVAALFRDLAPRRQAPAQSLRATLLSLSHNRAFVTLNLAMMAMIVAITILNKSVLYLFKYLLDNPAAGQLALASMGLVSAAAIPAWMLLGRAIGHRSLWFIAAGAASTALLLFAAVDIHRAGVMQAYLVFMQAMIVGLNFVFWAMLPNTIEFGEESTGLHVEGAVFGVAALLQRIAIGVATAILGWSFEHGGFVANIAQSAQTQGAIRWSVTIVPVLFLAFSCWAMLMNPLGRGVHSRLMRERAARAPAR